MEQDRNLVEPSLNKPTVNLEKHKSKEWKTYVLEFIMIFLAVSLGFVAEELRENRNESRLEREFAEVLYNERLSDSVQVSEILNLRRKREDDLTYLAAFFKDSLLTNLPREFYPKFTTSLYLSNSFTFEPKEGILTQLRNSGSSQVL